MTAPHSAGAGSDDGDLFLSGLAHELRTPLTVVVGYAELLRLRDDAAVRKEAAERIAEAAARLSHAIDDLFVVFALDGEHLVVDVEPVELEPAVQEAVRVFEGETPHHSIKLVAPATWPWVYGDQEHVGRLLADLLRVAARRTPSGSDIEVRVSADGASAALAVADSGPALSPEQLAALFERPPNASPLSGGTGLELYKARRLVELQGGAISATSGRQPGLIVTMTLPIADENLR